MSCNYFLVQAVRSLLILFLIFLGLSLKSQPSKRTLVFGNEANVQALKEEVFALRYSDPDRAINLCLTYLRELNSLGASSTRLFLYSTLGQLYADKSLPVLALSYSADAQYEYTQLRYLAKYNELRNSRPMQQPWLQMNMGNVYFATGNLERARDLYNQAEASFFMLDSTIAMWRGLSTTYNNLGLYFIESKEFQSAFHYVEKALDIRINRDLGPADISHSYSMMCNLFYKWGRADKAETYLKKVDSINHEFNESKLPEYEGYPDVAYTLAASYVGNVYEFKADYFSDRGEYKNAISAYRQAEKFYHVLLSQKARVGTSLANALLQLKDFETSLAILDTNIRLIRSRNLTKELEKALAIKIKVLDELHLADSARIISDELMLTRENRNKIQINQLLNGLDDKNETRIKSKELEAEILSDRKFLLLSIIAILVLTVIAGYFYSRKTLIDRKMILISKDDQLSRSKLEYKERELVSMSTSMLRENGELNALLKELLASVNLLDKKNDAAVFNGLISNLKKLISKKRNNESFAAQFSAAYPGYQEGLIQKHPDLNSGDLQLCTLLRLNLESKEIAQIIGLSIRSVESRRYRLRRKLNIEANVDLVSFLIAFK